MAPNPRIAALADAVGCAVEALDVEIARREASGEIDPNEIREDS